MPKYHPGDVFDYKGSSQDRFSNVIWKSINLDSYIYGGKQGFFDEEEFALVCAVYIIEIDSNKNNDVSSLFTIFSSGTIGWVTVKC